MFIARLVLAAAAVLVLGGCGTAPSTGTPTARSSSPLGSPAGAATPTALPSPSWSHTIEGEVAAFGATGEIETVLDVADTPFGLIAVGHHYSGTTAQPFGSVPDEARIWQSNDGYSWHDVTPTNVPAASLGSVVSLPDGSVLAFGGVVRKDEMGMPMLEPRTLVTRDGTTWQKADLRIGHAVRDIISGGRGYLALVANETGRTDIWYASELWDFQKVLGGSLDAGWGSIAAGPEGFVVVTMVPHENGVTSIIRASADGIRWFDAESGPTDVQYVAPSGPDWVAIGPGPNEERAEDSATASWFSANGLDWRAAGELALEAVSIDGGACRESVSNLLSTGDMLIAPTMLSYPCSEGGVVRFGRTSGTKDGATWDALPFVAPKADDTRGATVTAAIAIPEGSLLVGERDFQAVFWVLR